MGLDDVRALQRKWGVAGEVRPSTRERSKWVIIRPNGQAIHFGAKGYDDYTQHRDEKRRANYCARAGAIKNKLGHLAGTDPAAPNFYAMRLLWDCAPLRK